MRKTTNTVYLEGRIFSHELELRAVQNEQSKNYGKEYATGKLNIATDENGENVVTVHYTYEPPTFNSGKPNSKFKVLSDIINGKIKTWSQDGKENAAMVKITSSFNVNDWYDRDDNLVSSKRIEGGFINFVKALSDEKDRASFRADMLINNFTVREADEESGRPEYGIIKGAVFDFRNSLMPIEFSIENQAGINYFLDLEITTKNPVFTQVWGKIDIKKVIKKTIIESAFGEDEVRESEYVNTFYKVTGVKKEPYAFEEESEDLTPTELQKCLQDREVKLAEEKKRHDEAVANKNKSVNNVAVPSGDFAF